MHSLNADYPMDALEKMLCAYVEDEMPRIDRIIYRRGIRPDDIRPPAEINGADEYSIGGQYLVMEWYNSGILSEDDTKWAEGSGLRNRIVSGHNLQAGPIKEVLGLVKRHNEGEAIIYSITYTRRPTVVVSRDDDGLVLPWLKKDSSEEGPLIVESVGPYDPSQLPETPPKSIHLIEDEDEDEV